MKRTYSIEVKGRAHTWGLTVKAKPEHADDWRADGLDVWEVLNRVPVWAHQLGLTRIWCAVQDGWNAIRLW